MAKTFTKYFKSAIEAENYLRKADYTLDRLKTTANEAVYNKVEEDGTIKIATVGNSPKGTKLTIETVNQEA